MALPIPDAQIWYMRFTQQELFDYVIFFRRTTIVIILKKTSKQNQTSKFQDECRVIPLPSHAENVSHFGSHSQWVVLIAALLFSYCCLYMCGYYYASIRSLSLGAPFRFIFSISVALSLSLLWYYDACATLHLEEVMRGR